MPGPGLQASLMNTITLSEFTDLTKREFSLYKDMVQTGVAQQLFIYSNEQANTGNIRRFQEADIETFANLKREGADAAQAKVGVGYYKDIEAKRIAKEIQITWEMRRYNKHPEIVNQLTSLSHFCPQRVELDLTHVFTFATSTSYTDLDGSTVDATTGDGYTVCYSAHTLAFSTDTYRNRISGDPIFSQGALEAGELLMDSDIKSNFGEKRQMMFNKIVTSSDPTTCNTVRQVLQSTADIDAAHAGVLNVYKGAYVHVILPYLATTATGARDATKRKYWFLVSSGNGMANSWQAYYAVWEMPNLITPRAGSNGEDVHNDNWTYGCRMSYNRVVVSGRGIIGSFPTAS